MAISQETKGTIAVSLTNFLDSGCIVAASVALATTAWPLYFGIDAAWIAFLGAISANAFGAAIGALIGGFLTDRYGRKFIYTYNLLVYATGVFIVMIAMNTVMLAIGIFISGLSVGAGVPASWSYISEMSGSTRRAKNIGISQFAWSCGPAIIFLVSLILSFIFPTTDATGNMVSYGPFDGLLAMRILFLILFIVALVAWSLQRQLQESKDWAEKNANREKIGFGKLMGIALSNSINVKTILFLVCVYLTWNLVAGMQGQFMPYMYSAAGGLDDVTISLLNVVMWILTAVGSLAIFSALGDRIPHRVLFGVGAGMALLAWIIMVIFGTQLQAGNEASFGWMLWVYVGLWGISAGFSAQCFYALWSTELFPTVYRGGVQGIMFFLVRGALGVWSLVAVGILDVGTPLGFTVSGIVMCVFLAISVIVGVIGCPRTQGRTLDEITRERYGEDFEG